MTVTFERGVERKLAHFLPERPFHPFDRKLRDFLASHPRELCSWDEISRAVWEMPLDRWQRRVIRMSLYRLRLNPENSEGYFYTVRGFGAFFSLENIEGEPIGLRDIGVSLFLQGEDERKVIPGLSILSPEVWENQAINSESVLDLLDKLVWVKQKKRSIFLKPYLSPHECQLLACLAKGGICSKKELIQAAEITGKDTEGCLRVYAEECLRIHLHTLRKKIESKGLEILARRRSGWVLKQEV